MKRTILGVAILLMFGISSALIAQPQPAAPGAGAAAGRGPGGFGGAPGGRGGGRGFGAPVVIGPPAPVPPQVAMLRPSDAEMSQVNDAWKKFVASDNSAAKALLTKYESVLTLQGPRLNTAATFTQTAQRQGARHEGFVEIAKKGDIDLLFHGDSITDWWAGRQGVPQAQNEATKAVFDKYFGSMKTANFAIAGDTTQGVLWGLKNGEGQGFSPKAVMLMIGTNNMGPNTPLEIAEGIGAVVMEMRKDFPNAKILLLAIFPRSQPGDQIRDRIAETNRIISKLDDQQHVFYMDIGQKFLDEKGVFLADSFLTDNLHPAPKGYDLWGEAVKDKLAALMK